MIMFYLILLTFIMKQSLSVILVFLDVSVFTCGQECLCCDLARRCVSLILLVPEISGCLCAVHSKFRILTDAPVSNQSRHHIHLLNLL